MYMIVHGSLILPCTTTTTPTPYPHPRTVVRGGGILQSGSPSVRVSRLCPADISRTTEPYATDLFNSISLFVCLSGYVCVCLLNSACLDVCMEHHQDRFLCLHFLYHMANNHPCIVEIIVTSPVSRLRDQNCNIPRK